jgi:hypothetical protein
MMFVCNSWSYLSPRALVGDRRRHIWWRWRIMQSCVIACGGPLADHPMVVGDDVRVAVAILNVLGTP